jgi:MFS superfamily sulfate permease-like transporter
VFIALAVLITIIGFERVSPRVPRALLAVIGLTAASAYFLWSEIGVQVVGDVPSGLPHVGFPRVTSSDVAMVLPISFSCFIVIIAQSAASRARMPSDTVITSTRTGT